MSTYGRANAPTPVARGTDSPIWRKPRAIAVLPWRLLAGALAGAALALWEWYVWTWEDA